MTGTPEAGARITGSARCTYPLPSRWATSLEAEPVPDARAVQFGHRRGDPRGVVVIAASQELARDGALHSTEIRMPFGSMASFAFSSSVCSPVAAAVGDRLVDVVDVHEK